MVQVSWWGGCSARTATIIIGILQIIVAIIILVLIFVYNGQFLVSVDPDISKIMFIMYFCIVIINTILLLVGVFERNTALMVPWLVLGVFTAVTGLINIVVATIIYLVNEVVTSAVITLACGLIRLVIYIYSWLVVYSYFQQLKNDRTNSRIGLVEEPYNSINKLETGQN